MLYKSLAIFFMAIFYGIYFAKMYWQKKHGIRTNQMAKGKTKDSGYYTELLLVIATYVIPIIEVLSIVSVSSNLIHKILGLYPVIVGDVIFAWAVISMGDSWRAGVASEDEKGRRLVTKGIYKYSRNPAFLGFDLVYLGILIMFFNPILLFFTLFSMVIMHLQILNEEKYLEGIYGEEYAEYRLHTSRYFGLGEVSSVKLILYCYVILFVWSILYFITCFCYAGPFLSMIWMWLVIALFAAVRIWMLLSEINGGLRIPKILRIIYRSLVMAGLCVFVFVEINIITNMTKSVNEEMDYVIVLGAGLRGTTPTNPFRARLEKAYEYMSEHENTVLIASGGQGPGESISEAQCIYDTLVGKGIDPDRIILEDKSTSTEENLNFSFTFIDSPDASVGIITNGFHEYRAKLIAEDVGYTNISPVPAVTLFPVGIHYTVREFLGVMHYIVFG